MTDCILVGDVHITDEARRPTSRREGYTQQILDKIRFASTTAKELNVPLVFAGDVFHLKASSKNSHWLVQAFHDALQGVPTFIVPGNHDMSHDRLDSLPKQPLGALCKMDNVKFLIGDSLKECPQIVSVPYLTEFDGGDWKGALESWLPQIEGAELLVTHAPLFPLDQAPEVYNSIDPNEWAEVMVENGVSNTYYGHIHEYHGVYEVEVFSNSEAKSTHTFCNQGALSRGSLHESSINRKPAITSWINGEFKRIEVPHKPAEEVFIFEKAAQRIENHLAAKDFAEALGSVDLDVLTIEEVRDKLYGQTSDSKVIAVIEDVLDSIL